MTSYIKKISAGIIFIAAVTLFSTPLTYAYSPGQTLITGKVIKNGKPLAGVDVSSRCFRGMWTPSEYTNAQGEFLVVMPHNECSYTYVQTFFYADGSYTETHIQAQKITPKLYVGYAVIAMP